MKDAQSAIRGEPDSTIRPLQIDDVEPVTELSAALGYPVEATVMHKRIQGLLRNPDHTAFVACSGGGVVGWIDVAIVSHLSSDQYAEIGGLVVSGDVRSKGIGSRLVSQAERWAADKGISLVRVRSRIQRERAHHFYERNGYVKTKTSAVFEKTV